MRTLIVLTGTVVLLLGGAGGASAQDAARAILERAVKAHGGQEQLARHRADKVKFKGNLFLRGQARPFMADTLLQLPRQYKSIIEVREGAATHVLVHIVNGDKVYVTVDRQPEKLDAAGLAEIRDALEVQRAQRLLPLLADKSYQFAVLEEMKVNDRLIVGLRVTSRGRKELRLFFDKELGLLVKCEQVLDDGKGKQLRQEQFYGDFKDIGGIKRPTRVKTYRDGKLVMEAELLDAKYFDKIDDAEFAKP